MKNRVRILFLIPSVFLILTPEIAVAALQTSNIAFQQEIQLAPPRNTEQWHHGNPYYNKREQNKPYAELPPPHKTFTGFFVGVGGGMITGDHTNQTDISNDLAADSEKLLVENTNMNNKINAAVDFQLGYGKNFKPLYLAGVIFAQLGKEENSSNIPVTQINAETFDYQLQNKETIENRGVSYGFRLRAGLALDDKCIAYLLLGYIRTSYKVTSFNEYRQATPGNSIATVDVISGSTLNGVQFGLGIEKAFNASLSISIEYLYSLYPVVRLSGMANLSATPADVVTVATSISPKNQVLLVGINYYWGGKSNNKTSF